MKNLKPFTLLLIISIVITASSCRKVVEKMLKPPVQTDEKGFMEYVIKSGKQYSEQNGYLPFEQNKMDFMVRFDQTAVYRTVDEANQGDINKLYGFSDNNEQHHRYSARIGWCYYNNRLSLFAYVYNNSQRVFKEICNIEIGKEYHCTIQNKGAEYSFSVNDKTVTLPREATSSNVKGYKLYPYFGGTETAPHDIHIFIKDL